MTVPMGTTEKPTASVNGDGFTKYVIAPDHDPMASSENAIPPPISAP